ncbi:hypothetical protein [Actinotalea ferrariae]|nr:hypothetical protein [Actinotalea ferrariae]
MAASSHHGRRVDGVTTHLQHVDDQLDVRDRAAAVGEGYRRGLLR